MTLPVPTSSPLLHMPKTRQLLAALFSGELGFSNAQGLASDAFFEAQAFAYMVGSKLKSQMSHRNASLDGGGTSAALSGAVNYVNEGGRSLLKLGSHSAVFIVNGFSYAFNVMVDYLIFFATLNYLYEGICGGT